jgi:hypothetical protein
MVCVCVTVTLISFTVPYQQAMPLMPRWQRSQRETSQHRSCNRTVVVAISCL